MPDNEKRIAEAFRSVSQTDHDRPRLWYFFLLELFKWGFLCLAAFLLIKIAVEFVYPYIESIWDFTTGLVEES